MRTGGLSILSATFAAGLASWSVVPDAAAQYSGYRGSPNRTTVISQPSSRYVSRGRRAVAVPLRGERWFNAPRGAIELRGRYWDPRTRWVVDARTHSTYAVLSNGEVWFLEPSSGWGYTVDRYGRVYTADPRRRSVYALNDLSSWRGDLYYFFSYFAPWDGYYTVRNYDWFYSSYDGRRNTLYDYGYAYNQTWDLFDDYYDSRDFYRTVDFHYYEPSYIRYDRGWSRGYWHNSVPSVYIAPVYNYTVVNNVVVINQNVYNRNYGGGAYGVDVNNRGGDRGLPTAQQAAIELAADVGAPPTAGFNAIDRRGMQDAGFSVPVEPIKQATAMPVAAVDEPTIEIPGLTNTPVSQLPSSTSEVLSEPTVSIPAAASADPAAAEQARFEEPVRELPSEKPLEIPFAEQPASEVSQKPSEDQPVREQPVFEEPTSIREEPVFQEQAREQQVFEQPVREEPAYQEPTYQEPIREEPAFEEQAREQPVFEEPVREEPIYQEPAYQEPLREEPAYQEPAYEEPVREEPVYEEPAYEAPEQPAYEEPAYQEPAYEAPSEEPAYEAPSEESRESSADPAPSDEEGGAPR